MKKLLFAVAAVAAASTVFGTRMIECGSSTRVLSPMRITSITAATAGFDGTVNVTNRIDLSFVTNALSKVVITNGWIVQVGKDKIPVVNTNTVVKSFRVERHVDVPVGSVTLSGGYGSVSSLDVPVAPGDTLVVNGADAVVRVFGD